jgi:hypothetical protein
MAGISLVISIVALVVAYLAYTKSGGSIDDLKRKVDELHLKKRFAVSSRSRVQACTC